MIIKRYLFLVIFIFSISVSFGQKADSLFYAQNSRINGKYIGSYFTEFGKAAISPIGWNGGEWITFGGFAATEGILMNFDNDIQNWFPHKSNSDNFFKSYKQILFRSTRKRINFVTTSWWVFSLWNPY